MKTQLQKQVWLVPVLLLYQVLALAQGLPPGWDFITTPTTHIVAIPLGCEPNINGFPINQGDWIGAFFVDDDGELACGGAIVWNDTTNTGLIVFGNDSFTPGKDGFFSGETMNYKVYSWSVGKAYDAEVTCNDALPSPCDIFTPNGLSGFSAFNASGFYSAASAMPDTLCTGEQSQLNANASGGSGTYTYAWTSNPAGFTSNVANPLVSPEQNTTYTVQVTNSGETLSNSVLVSFFPGPEVSAGVNRTICENELAALDGNALNYQSIEWTTNGDGLFSNPAILNPVYTPGTSDILSGNVILTLFAQALEPCTATVSSDLQLAITVLPQVNAGADQTVCENVVVQLAAIASNFSSLLWTTSGDGSFSNPTIANAVYTPGPGDVASGTVDLEIECNPMAPCTGSQNDFLTVEIVKLPAVNAGNNIVICEDNVAQINGTVNNFESILWVSNGDGIFAEPTSLSTTYTPGTGDIQSGAVVLSLVAQPLAPCIVVITDNLNLSIVMQPGVSAGVDATVCEDDVHQLNASANNYEEVIWSTSGDGVFGNPNALGTSYTPGGDDIIAGLVTLTITALPEFPCAINAEDVLMLTVMNLPYINAGDDDSVCEGNSFSLIASAENYTGLLWSTSGDGSFADPGALITTYIPGAGDILTGNVELTITASPLFPCVSSTEDHMNLSVVWNPEANAGDDATICEDNTHQLDGQALNYLFVQWITSGDGSFNNIAIFDPVYTPGPADILGGNVMLSLTALPLNPCTQMQQSDLTLTITFLPVADAGPDATVPKNDVHQLDGAASDFSSLLWTTSGDGNFSDPGILDPFYSPGEQDIAIAQVTLTLTATAVSPCVVSAMDDMILEIDTLVGIQTIGQHFELKTFPNPTKGQLQVDVSTIVSERSCTLKMFTINGEQLINKFYHLETRDDGQSIPLDISVYPNGVYLVQVISGNRIWQSKIILTKE
jgi:hypothetical protein